MPAAKPATAISVDASLTVDAADDRSWVSRGAHKLIGALDAFGISVADTRCLDAGASTGGFTQVLLDRGAREVVAVDVGHDQLSDVLRADPRVHDYPGTTVRGLDPAEVGGPAELLVADLSFISLQVVLPDLLRLVAPGGDLL